MPDWSYQTLLRPLLFSLPAERARDLTFSAVGHLVGLPLGPGLIELMGHMRPPPGIAQRAWDAELPSPIGLSAGLDAHARGLRALARLGFGFLELGPITEQPLRSPRPVERRVPNGAIWYPDLPVNEGLAATERAVVRAAPFAVPLGLRLAHRPWSGAAEAAAERCRVLERLVPYASFVTVETRWGAAEGQWSEREWADHLGAIQRSLSAAQRPLALLVCLAPDLEPERIDTLLDIAVRQGAAGIVVDGGIRADHDGRVFGPAAHEPTLRFVRSLRERRIQGSAVPIIACGGVHEPIEALQLVQAGASLVTLHSGLVYAGPGLPKRINEALAYAAQRSALSSDTEQRLRPNWTGWLWITLLGAALVVGGLAALIVAATRVVLPYDEAFLGLSREQMLAINPRLLGFLAHDRMTFAGIMLSLGVLYGSLAWNGMRRGMRWAAAAVRASGLVGFASFFLFVGYGYFDPLHAATSVILCVFFVLGLRGQLPAPRHPYPNLHNDWRWRIGLWGQLLLVAIGIGLLLGGLAISGFGVSVVFVPSDLRFMGTTAEALAAANPNLLPLVAHDRAGFGGALVAEGVLVLLTALWGFRERARWLWWTLVVAGAPAFSATIGTHFVVGYVDTVHLAPAYLALALYVLALALSYPYLVAARDHRTGTRRELGRQGAPDRIEPLAAR